MQKKVTSALTTALVISLILIVLDLVAGFTHIKFETWWRWIPTVVLCIALIWACINYANQKDNLVTFGNVWGFGFKTSAFVAVITLVYSFLSIYVIFPETRDLVIDESRKQMEAQGKLSEDQIDQALEMTRKFFVVGLVIGVVVGTLIAGALASLLGAAFAKKKPVTPFEQPRA